MTNRRTPSRALAVSLLLVLLIGLAMGGRAPSAAAQDGPAASPQAAPGMAITFQGRLAHDGLDVDAICDMTFSLFDAQTLGGLVAGPLNMPVHLRDGLFSASLDFGAGAFDVQPRWLEIAVRCPGDAAVSTLPRVSLNPVPYALYSPSVPWGGVTGVPADIANGDTNTTYQAGFGLTLSGTVFSLTNPDMGDITEVVPGTGLTGGGINGDVWLTADTAVVQSRVSGVCPEGQSIRVINADGTVVCEVDTAVIFTPGNQLRKEGDTLHVVEGADSGLDVDLVDGRDSTYYLDAGNLAGTLSPNRYSALADLAAEGYLGNENNDIAQNNGVVQQNLNADLLDGSHGSDYQNATNLNDGTLSSARFSAWSDLGIEGKLGTENGLALNNGVVQTNLNAELLDGLARAAYQERVDGACSAGQAIRSIAVDGTVTCEPDDATTYLPGNQVALVDGKLNVVEGPGSGLDGDTLDGEHGADYHDAGKLTGGLSTDRFSARDDLADEGYLGDEAGDLAQNDGIRQPTLNADVLDSLDSSHYLNASNAISGTLDAGRYSAWGDLQAEGKLGTANGLALNDGNVQPNLNTEKLNGLPGSAYQWRVSGTCGAGQAIGSINEDGSVVCRPAGSGDITGVVAGEGLLGGAGAGTAPIAADLAAIQTRVAGTCTSGQAIRAIHADGTVECQAAGMDGDIMSVTVPGGGGLLGGGEAGDVTVSVDLNVVQARVSGTCAGGYAPSAIQDDGTFVCAYSGGSVTGVWGTNGLTGGSDGGTAALSASLGSSGSATTVSRSDHNHDTTYVNEGQAGAVTSGMLVDGTSLANVLASDGSGSGLDADNLDGYDSVVRSCGFWHSSPDVSLTNSWTTIESCTLHAPRSGIFIMEMDWDLQYLNETNTCSIWRKLTPAAYEHGTDLDDTSGSPVSTNFERRHITSTSGGDVTIYFQLEIRGCTIDASHWATVTWRKLTVMFVPGS